MISKRQISIFLKIILMNTTYGYSSYPERWFWNEMSRCWLSPWWARSWFPSEIHWLWASLLLRPALDTFLNPTGKFTSEFSLDTASHTSFTTKMTLTQHNHTELAAAHLRGAYNDHIGWQALLLRRTLSQRAQRLRDAFAQRVVCDHHLDAAARDARFQPSQPG